MIIMNPYRHAAGLIPYKYYKFDVTVWNDASWRGQGEIAFYDDVANLGNVGIGNGQLDIHGTSGTAGADHWLAGAEPYRAADGDNTTTRWLSNLVGTSLWQFVFDTTPTNPVLAYSIWSANSAVRMMNTFTLEGSQDGVEWDILDSRTGVSVTFSYEVRNFEIGVPGIGE